MSTTAALNRPPYAAFDVVAMAASTGGLAAYSRVLAALPADFPAAILAVQHRDPRYADLLPGLLRRRTELSVEPAVPGGRLCPGTVYVAPADRQLLVGRDRRFKLDLGRAGLSPPRRCAADPLFASVAAVAGERAIAVVLTGKLDDGATGARAVKLAGGRVLAQDRITSDSFDMPNAAIRTGCVDFVLPLDRIAAMLVSLVMVPGAAELLRVPKAS